MKDGRCILIELGELKQVTEGILGKTEGQVASITIHLFLKTGIGILE